MYVFGKYISCPRKSEILAESHFLPTRGPCTPPVIERPTQNKSNELPLEKIGSLGAEI